MNRLYEKSLTKGFSLIELLLVLGVLAILLVAAFVVYPQVRDRNQANETSLALSTIRANVNNLYASKPGNYRGLTPQVALNAKVFPSNMVSGEGSSAVANSPWGGLVEVSADNPSNQKFFRTRIYGMSSRLCTLLVPNVAKDYEEVMLYLTSGSGIIFTASSSPGEIVEGCNLSESMDVVFAAK